MLRLALRSFDSTQDILPDLPAIRGTDVAVVEVGLDVADGLRQPLESLLDPDERERARRFAFADDRRRYQMAHAALRLVLGHCLDEDPHALRFERGRHGKPRLARHLSDLEFNLSHSGERGLIAVARRDVGIDIEVHRPDVEIEKLAALVLSTAEQCAFNGLPGGSRRAAFYRAWARKESFVKAIGEGLTCPLDSFDVSLEDEVASALLACRHPRVAASEWTMVPIDVGRGAAAALTVSGPLRCRGRGASVWTFA